MESSGFNLRSCNCNNWNSQGHNKNLKSTEKIITVTEKNKSLIINKSSLKENKISLSQNNFLEALSKREGHTTWSWGLVGG